MNASLTLKLKRFARSTLSLMSAYGISPLRTIIALRETPRFIRDYRKFKEQLGPQSNWAFGRTFPILHERHEQSGNANGHYFHQDLYVARKIFLAKPNRHIDVGSRVDGFVAHVASYREIEIADIRPLDSTIPNIKFIQIDLSAALDQTKKEICDSLSCLHVLEHIGLGRYGDTVAPYGYKQGFDNLVQMLKQGGTLYFSVPIGRQRIEFNAHRIFGIQHLLEMFEEHKLSLKSFSYVGDDGNLVDNVKLDSHAIEKLNQLNWGCGIFELTRA